MSYEFTQDFFSGREEQFLLTLEHVGINYKDQPIRILEIGSFEGRSACWFSDNLLDHEESQLVCVDNFKGNDEHKLIDIKGLSERFLANTRKSKNAAKISCFGGDSATVLTRTLLSDAGAFDMAYVDGSHDSQVVMLDGALCWLLLRDHGVIFFDDYHRPSFGDAMDIDPDPIKRAVDVLLPIYPMQLASDSPLMRAYVKKKRGRPHGNR